MRVQPATARYTVEESDSFLRITIRPERGAWGTVVVELLITTVVVLFALVLLVMNAAGGLVSTTNDGPPLLVRWFLPLFLLVAGLWRTYKNVWHVAGCERIVLTADALLQTLNVGSLVRTRRFALAGVTGLRVPLENGALWAEWEVNRREGPRGMIQFEHQRRTRRLGIGLHVSEAQAILTLLEARVARR